MCCVVYVIIAWLCRNVVANCGQESGGPVVEVLIWSGGSWAGFMAGNLFKAPNYLGHDVDKSTVEISANH